MNAQHRRRLVVGIVAVAPGIAAAVIVWMPRHHAAPAIAGMVRRAEVRIAPEIAGRLAAIEVQAGQTVRKGELLAVLSNPELGAALGEAEG